MQTHEAFIAAVAQAAIARIPSAEARKRLSAIKLVYGSGPQGTRGVTFFGRWVLGTGQEEPAPFVEVSAFGQSSVCQLAGTTIHELAHVLAGPMAGHGPAWKAACEALGLRCVKAAGTHYHWACFAPDLRFAVASFPVPNDGAPVSSLGALGVGNVKACTMGIGTRGGRSRGKGAGSRYRLWSCPCGVKARVASDTFAAVHVPCGELFRRT